jgi:hypothetical protein
LLAKFSSSRRTIINWKNVQKVSPFIYLGSDNLGGSNDSTKSGVDVYTLAHAYRGREKQCKTSRSTSGWRKKNAFLNHNVCLWKSMAKEHYQLVVFAYKSHKFPVLYTRLPFNSSS